MLWNIKGKHRTSAEQAWLPQRQQLLTLSQRKRRGNQFTYVIGTEPLTLDAHLISDANTGRVSVQIHENLVKRDLEGNFKPVLATEWSSNEDATEWTFKLREGVTFHDGEPFNAEAVKFNIDRLKDPATGSPKSSLVSMISDYEIINDYEIKFILEQPVQLSLQW